MSGLPEYSEEGLAVRDLFYTGLANVHIFVEDESLENVYTTLFERLFPALESFEIFPLSGKRNVISHARSAKDESSKAVRVYVLDKDFDDILDQLIVMEGVFYLDQFNIEMAVVDETSLLRICVEERPRLSRTALKERLKPAEALEVWMPFLDRLHRAFALVQKHQLGIQNTDLAPERFTMPSDPSSFEAARIDEYVARVAQQLVVAGVVESPEEYPELSRKIFGSSRIYLKHTNGKFIAKLFFHRMKRRRLVSNLTQDSMLMRCVGSSELKRLRSFRANVSRYLKSKNML